ncbi:phage head-tail joining protein [Xanthobacter versatilis]|uniref:phage head-tail joining protein n=1 Tax=Xanthobacter autotrophicus (strain ATCC BAA-1158 / Py2) TaxID=78245 RepID=UPI00372947DE
MDLAELIARRDALRKAIAGGVLKVEYRDRSVWYQSTENLLAALRELEAQIAAAEGKPRIRFHTISKDRGW